jgi:pyruvate-ferredoxin/flavodoxin oxidoreductase
VVDPRDGAERVASDEMVALADERVRLWRTLQELAGVVTPFTQRVREDAERSVAGDRTREIEALRREHAAALAALRDGFELEAVGRVREGLMRLAGYGPDADEADGSGAG